jgi:hypothetical protein
MHKYINAKCKKTKNVVLQLCNRVLGIHQNAELQIAKHKKTFAMGSVTMMPPVGSETLKKLVAIAATLLVVSAGTEVPLEGSG